MQIVTILGDKELEARLSKELVPNIECNIINHENPDDFVSLCQIVPDVDALICDENHVQALMQICKQNHLPLDFIYIRNLETDKKIHDADLNFHNLSKNQSFLEYIKNNLNHTCIPITADSEHRSIPIRYLNSISKAPANFYYKVQKEAFAHYVKLIKKGDPISTSFIEKKQQKGLKLLWVEKADKPEVIKLFNSIFLSILDQNNISKAYLDRDSIHQDIFELLTSIGLNESDIKLAEYAIKDLQANMSKGLIQSINKMFKLTAGFSYKKSYLTCMVICSFTRHISWVSEAHTEALLFCAFFNDIFLTSTDMHLISSDFDLNNAASLPPKQITVVEKHAEMASEWIEKLNKLQNCVPPEVIRLVKQHHGSSNGIGFKTEFDKTITKLSQLFIVCEEFSDLLLKTSHSKPNIGAILTQIKDKYASPTIHTLTDALLLTIKKELNKS